MVFNSSNSSSSSNYSGGGGGPFGTIIVAVAAVALIGLSVVDLFALSLVMFAAIGGYLLLLAILYFWVGRNMVIHRERVQFCLFMSAIAAASINFLVFQWALAPFILVAGVAAAFFLLALVGGLFAELSGLAKVVALAVVVVLIGAPFSEPVRAKERWRVMVHVRNLSCEPLPDADAQCRMVSAANADIPLSSARNATTDANGDATVSFPGNALGKAALCEASRPPMGDLAAYPPYSVVARPPLFGVTHAYIQLIREDETNPYVSGRDTCAPAN